MAQMFGATVSIVLLFRTGLSIATLIATALTTGCMLFSRALYRRERS